MENKHIPTIDEIKSFISAYGWHFRETTSNNGVPIILSNFGISPEKGVLLSFHIEGEFMLASTVGFLQQVPKTFALRLLEMNDTLKLVKLYSLNTPNSEMITTELGFELWNEAWNKDAFFAFVDMLCLGIETVLKKVTDEQIPHSTNFIAYQKPAVQQFPPSGNLNPTLNPTSSPIQTTQPASETLTQSQNPGNPPEIIQSNPPTTPHQMDNS